MNKQIAQENLLIIKEEFQKNNVVFWLTDGTLLGAFRENDFISHDTDTDIGVFAKDMSKISLIVKNLELQGFNLHKSRGILEDGFKLAIIRMEVKTDIFFFYESKKDPNLFYHSAYANFEQKASRKYDFFYNAFEIGEIKFLNHDFPCPKDVIGYLKQKYGSDFMIPKKKWSYWKNPKNVKDNQIKVDNHSAAKALNAFLKMEG
jgi:phosphorylcholine metabolism protein LicD